MRVPGAAEFPQLEQVLSGYLHEDFLAEHGSAAAAIRAFETDASPAERRRFRREARLFLERTAPLPFGEVRALLAQLGCRWSPASRRSLAAALSGGSQ